MSEQLQEEYSISRIEIKRRQAAYATLVVGLTVGVIAALYIWTKDIKVFIYLIPIAVLFLLSILILSHFFAAYLKTKVILTNDYIEKKRQEVSEKIAYHDIKRIAIRYTTRDLVRDIIIVGKEKTLAIDGLVNFMRLKESLIRKNPNKIKESKEHLDYDNSFFYITLGFLVGFIIPFGIIQLVSVGENWANLIIIIYTLIVGLFFVINHPIARRYGDKKPLADTVFGLLLIIVAVSIYLWSK